jgi:hypothetical protein
MVVFPLYAAKKKHPANLAFKWSQVGRDERGMTGATYRELF